MLNNEQAIENAAYYDESGKPTSEFKTSLLYSRAESFYIKEFKGSLFVKGTVVRKHDRERLKWRKVGEKCFNNYKKYLQTNQDYCYNLANRTRDE